MKQINKEFMTQHLLVLCAMSIIGALVRNAAMTYGIDGFSCNLVFVVSTTILMVIYIHVSHGISRWLVPLLDKHIFHNLVHNIGRGSAPTYSDYELLRKEALVEKNKKEKELLEAAVNYTRKTLAAYMKEEHLNQLCEYIALFHRSTDTPRSPHNMKVDKAIRTIDLYHYAWNIGNIFKKKGIHTATFIKQAFAEALHDVEITTIVRKLRMEGDCIIPLMHP